MVKLNKFGQPVNQSKQHGPNGASTAALDPAYMAEVAVFHAWRSDYVTARLGQLRCYDALGDFERQLESARQLRQW